MAYLHNVETKTCTSSAETKISTLNIKSPDSNSTEYHSFSPMNGSYKLLTQTGSQYVWVDQAKAEEIINERPVTATMVKEMLEDYARTGSFSRYESLIRREPEEVENANTGE